jgi:AAA15 family ATPase/GTPase
MSYEKLKIDVEYPAELLQKLKSLSDKQEAELRMLFRMDEEKHIVNTFHRLDKKTGNRRGRLPLSEQSDGTKEILRFLIVLDEAIRKEKTIILDDYSSGVQRNTLNQLLKFFLGAAQNAQLIISTQDYSLLDFDIIRRDERVQW